MYGSEPVVRKREECVKRIKSVLHLIHSGGFYGAESVILNLSLGLKEFGILPIIGCFWDKGTGQPLLGKIAEEKGIKVRYIHFNRKIELLGPLKQIHRIIHEENISIVHSHGYKPSFYCLLINRFCHIPYVITCHLWTNETFRLKVYSLIDRISMLFARKVIAVSHPIADDICSWKSLRKKVEVINNGIDIEKSANCSTGFDPKRLRQELGLKENTRLVGTLGRLTFQKAHHFLIEAAKIVLEKRKDIEFLIAGEGPRLKFLERMTDSYGISDQFHFVGFRRDAINILRLLDVFVLCSIDEGLPIVLLEAMSVGTPIVTTNVGEIPCVIRGDWSGLLIKSRSVDSLSKSIGRLLDNRRIGSILAKNAKETVQHEFSIANMTNKYLNQYRSIEPFYVH